MAWGTRDDDGNIVYTFNCPQCKAQMCSRDPPRNPQDKLCPDCAKFADKEW